MKVVVLNKCYCTTLAIYAGISGIYRCDIETNKSSVTNEVGHETAYVGLYINGGE